MLESGAEGLYHVTNEGETTWHGFAAEIFRQAGLPTRLQAITTAEYGAKAARPRYSVLDCRKYQALGGPRMSRWQDALNNYMRSLN